MTKRCPSCGVVKEIGDFYADRRARDGVCSSCKACIRKRQREQRQKNGNATLYAWRERNRERHLAIARAYWHRHTARIKARQHANREKYRAVKNAYSAKWKRENRERWDEIRAGVVHRRRARERGVKAERFDVADVIKRDGMKCYLCRRRVARKDLSFDHVVPLSKGGTHTPENVRVTHLKCNLKKNTHLVLLPFEAEP